MRRFVTGVVAACALLLGGAAHAQVAFDAASNAAPLTVSNANPVVVQWNHTVGSSKKPYVVISVSLKLSGGGATVGSVTWASEADGQNQPATFLGAATNGTTTRAELWGVANPQPGTHRVSVSVTNAGGQNLVVVAGAKSFTNVFQSSPTGTVVTATGTSTTPAVTAANVRFAAVVDAVAFNANTALTAGANQVNAYNLTNAAPVFSGAGSNETGQLNSVMSWTAGASLPWAIAAVPLLPSSPQILFDAASSTTFASALTTFTGAWNHTTTIAANRYLVVGANIDESGGASTVSGVRYGTELGGPNVAMTVLGTRANGTNVRTELWGLVAPAPGTHQITVTIAGNTGLRNTNVVAGAQSFSGVEQQTPTGVFVSNSANSATPAAALTNSAYDYVVDSIAWNSNNILAAGAQQDGRFGIVTTAAGAVTNFFGGGSGARGYANVTMSWTPPGAQNWSMGAIPLKAATVQLKMTASADVVKLGQPITYTITATNYGAAAATNVTISDAIPAGAVFLSQTGCAGTGPVSCNIGTLAAGATSGAITVTIIANAAGPITNTSTVAFNGSATLNNSETLTTLVEGRVCATPGKDGAGGTLAGIKNDYWPGASTVAAGATSLTIGARAASGAGNAIAAGDLLIIMQMQDAAFDTTNDETYGEGSGSTRGTGIGSGAATTLNNAGRWEYAIAANSPPVAGGALQITGGGSGGGLLYGYTSQTFAATSTQGQRTWQVIRVPQYTTATLGSTLTALAWNGSTGAVLAIDVSGTLTLGGATVSVNGLGFRGGAGRLLNGDPTTGLVSTDFRTSASLTTNGSKGEGITGTPRYVYQSGAAIGAPGVNTALDTGVEGYVSGSYGRGAPGNAGGGSTDGDPAANDMNSGGGGGGNGGAGGAGGNGWSCNCPSGGQGGGSISPNLTRITPGGGGGAGTSNNGSAADATGTVLADANAAANGYYSSGANGGGVIIIRALQATGTATLTANGFSAYNTGRDGSGGGGAGGSVLLTTQTGGLSGVTIQAKGGKGGNAWLLQAPAGSPYPTYDPGERHGPGGGGGGGYVLLSGAAASVDVSGGANGVTTTALDDYGAQAGSAGVVEFISGANVLAGGDGATCAAADLAVTDSVSTTMAVDNGNNITFNQTLVNNGPSPADSIVYTTYVPDGTLFQSMTVPAGWTCITPAVDATGAITCTRQTLTSANGVQNFAIVVQATGDSSGYIIANTNNVTSLTPDTNTANNTAAAQVPLAWQPNSDMSVTLTNNATTTNTAGSNVTFTSVATNIGPAAATSATWSMPIPANTTFQSIGVPAGWTCITPAVNGTGSINCSASGTIASGAAPTFTPVFKVVAGTAAGSVITGTATTGATNDVNAANNIASSSFTVRGAAGYDMVETIAAAPTPAFPGENVTFTSIVSNNGPANAPASGAGVQWVMAVPAGMNFQSVGAVPAGWTCVAPAIGASGTITCTYQTGGINQPYAPGSVSTFKPVFQVNASTASGTTINGSASVNINGVTTADNVPANNSASAPVLVTASTNADVAILKSVAPNSIGNFDSTAFTLAITNNGPATATNVVISDTLPATLSYVSNDFSFNNASCSYNSGTTTITCSISTLAVGNTVTVSIVARPTTTGTIPNTASIVGADQTDPVPANNSSTANLNVFAVTLVKMRALAATQSRDNVVVTWQTSHESDNLGFNVYRDVAGQRTKVNKHLIAGAAIGSKDVQKAGHAYRVNDKLPSALTSAQYWLEDVDLKGVHTMHGPVSPSPGTLATAPDSPSLGGIGSGGAVVASPAGIGVVQPLTLSVPTSQQTKAQLGIAADGALKIYVSQEGWYRISRAEMAAAGFDPGADDRKISLFMKGVEQPVTATNGDVEFYGLPLDTASTGARTYWLTSGKGTAYRIQKSHNKGADPVTGPLAFTYDRRERSAYFSSLMTNGDEANFFGPVVTTEGATQQLDVGALDTTYGGNATLTIVAQGCNGAQRVALQLNGHDLGTQFVPGELRATWTIAFPQAYLAAGANTLTLQELGGEEDVTFIVDTRLTYQHLLRADNGLLEIAVPGGRAVSVGGFTNSTVRAIDVTDPQQPAELETIVVADPNGGFVATFTTVAGASRNVLVFDSTRALGAPEMVPNKPSTWLSDAKSGGDLLIITNSGFTAAANKLAAARNAQGITSAVVDVDDVYDEVNFGTRDPQAIRTFIETAVKSWKATPKWIVLIGNASIDPRNYFETGVADYVPTKLLPTLYGKTASDDWFTDFDGDGIADIPVGRIPVRNASDADRIIGRITSRGTPSGAWATRATFIHDSAVGFDFAGAATAAARLLPPTITAQHVGPDGAAITAALNDGALLTEYIGHGSVELWGEDLFDFTAAAALTNGNRLPFVAAMTCLNGLFNDTFSTSLAEGLMTAPGGGAVGVWASSTLTEPDVQALMNDSFIRELFTPGRTVGEAVRNAKRATPDPDVRRSWILFGDPSMKIQQ